MSTKRVHEGPDEPPTAKRQQLATGWTASEISSTLPPLPKPADPRLEEQAFQHPSLHDTVNYEALEWVGDGWIQAISSQLIYATFRHSLKAGRLSQLRERLVCNKALCSFLRAYGLDARLKLPNDILDVAKAKDKRKKKDPLTVMEKIHGDVFEAYVGAIIQSDGVDGLEIATDWLKKLWSREIQDEIRKLNHNYNDEAPPTASADQDVGPPQASAPKPPALNSKVLLNQAIMCRGATLDYRDMPGKTKKDKMGHSLFAVGVYFSGWGVKDDLLGIGTALKKSEAGTRAAEEALKNKKLMKTYGEKKQAYLKARDEAEARQGT
jgi:ribonuclease-3